MIDYQLLYSLFNSPLQALDCGERCSPHNAGGQPFCCDTRHAVPSAYLAEWDYLCTHTALWHLWQPAQPAEYHQLANQAPEGQVLIECQGAAYCQRAYRAVTCRSFPFFPYLTKAGEFSGLSYYWQYEDRCWVISHLHLITQEYLNEFVATYETLFSQMPAELSNFRYHSMVMRRIFGRQHRAIPLFHRNGAWYKVTPRNGRMRRVAPDQLPLFGPYKIAAQLPFKDEV